MGNASESIASLVGVVDVCSGRGGVSQLLNMVKNHCQGPDLGSKQTEEKEV